MAMDLSILDNMPTAFDADTTVDDNEPMPVITQTDRQPASERRNGKYYGLLPLGQKSAGRTVYSQRERAAICERVLPLIASGQPVYEVAQSLGISCSTLSGWLIAGAAPQYTDALKAHVGERMAAAGRSLEGAQADAQAATEMILDEKMVQVGGGKMEKWALLGDSLAKASKVSAEIAERTARYWQWVAERRFPAEFGGQPAPGGGLLRASFTFIVDGRQTDIKGRVIDQVPTERAGQSALDITPVIGTEPTYPQDIPAVIPKSADDPTGS